ncbi:MAG TPA: DUF3187 family protein [Gemmatimonadales bacterium]
MPVNDHPPNTPAAVRRRDERAPAARRLTAAVRLVAVAGLVLSTAPAPLRGQDGWVVPAPPQHEPLNPAVVARSGLHHLPMEPAAPRWSFATTAEYGSVVERNLAWPDLYLYDAELLRVQVTARRDLGERAFVRLQGGVTGAYDGFADAFFEGYHQLIQWVMPERDTRPRNRYGARLTLSEHALDLEAERHVLLPTDLRATVGMRLGDAHQTALSVTAPLAPARSVFARGAPSVSLTHTARAAGRRLTAEGSVGVGFTPRAGELSEVQRTMLTMAAGGAGFALARNHSLYVTLFHHSAPYRGTGFPELDHHELSADFGYAWRSPSGRVWRFGLTEDLRRRDPGIDLVVKVGVE